MKSYELDYLGVLPYENEDRGRFKKRGEQFLEDAYELKGELEKDARHILKENDILKLKLLQDRDVTGNPKMVDSEIGFFEREYRTNPEWISVIEAECIDAGGIQKDISFKGKKIPIAIVDTRGGALTKHHEEIHCVRREFLDTTALSPEEHLVKGLTNEEWRHTPSINYDKRTARKNIMCGMVALGGLGMMAHTSPPSSAMDYGTLLFLAIPASIPVLDGIVNYRNRDIMPTKTAFYELILSEEENSSNKVMYGILYYVLRLLK